jgi:hypothetical protein
MSRKRASVRRARLDVVGRARAVAALENAASSLRTISKHERKKEEKGKKSSIFLLSSFFFEVDYG